MSGFLRIPTLLPDTTNALVLYLPATTLSVLKTSNIGRPDWSLTAINEPVRESVILKREPAEPINAT